MSRRVEDLALVLFPDSQVDRDAFYTSLIRPASKGSAVLWTVPPRRGELDVITRDRLPPWVPDCVEVLIPGPKIGRHPAYLAGEVYPLDFGSVVAGSALLELRNLLGKAPHVLDTCAAPGGKSLLASVLLNPELLLSNEVDRNRLGPLRHNLSRCRAQRAYTQSLPVEELARLAPGAFDVCLVDAPCSGQSLLVKGTKNPGCFRADVVKGNAKRQRRILSAAAKTLAPGGFLLYTTCTFSLRENEEVIERFLSESSDFLPRELSHLAAYRSPHADFPCYRTYPHDSLGAGGFSALLWKCGGEAPAAGLEGLRPALPPPLLDYPVTAAI